MLSDPYLLPEMDEYLLEESFARVGIARSDRGLSISVSVEKGFEECHFPAVEKGDGVEVFIDTRGIDDAFVVHKYCHHFIFLPKPVDGIEAVEVTKFRGEDKHEHCKPETLSVLSTMMRSSYSMEIQISEMSLFGYDPDEYPRIGFAMRIHRPKGGAQHFPMNSVDYKIEAHPNLWARLELK